MFLNMFRAQAWRLVKSRATWIVLAVFAAFIAAGVAALAALTADERTAVFVMKTSSDISRGVSAVSREGGVEIVQACGALFVKGSAVAMFAAVFSGVFVASDVRTGAIKGVVQGRYGRLCYAVAAISLAAVVSALYVAMGIAVSALSLLAAGFPLAAPDLPRLCGWAAEVTASVWAYSALTVAVALVSKSAVATTVAGLLLGGAAAENVLYSAFSLATGRPDEVRAVFDGYLAVAISRLGDGSVLPAEATVPALATLAAALAVCVLAMRRKSLA